MGSFVFELILALRPTPAHTEADSPTTIPFSRSFIALLGAQAFNLAGVLGGDLELFATHAKRSKVSMDDVMLAARKSESLVSVR